MDDDLSSVETNCYACMVATNYTVGEVVNNRLDVRKPAHEVSQMIKEMDICQPNKFEDSPAVDIKGVNPFILLDACDGLLKNQTKTLVQVLKDNFDEKVLENGEAYGDSVFN